MLVERCSKISEGLARGDYLGDIPETGKMVGRYLEARELIELTYEQLRGEEDADRTQHTTTD